MTDKATLIEVGPRDGFQPEAKLIPTELKLDIIHGLAAAGLSRIQATSFVHPKYVPQMADAEDVCAGLARDSGVTYTGLALNGRGVERAADAGIAVIELSMSASDTHQQKNARRGRVESIAAYRDMYTLARSKGLGVRAGIMCCFGCVYEGAVPPRQVLEIAELYAELGADAITISDSTGMGHPGQVKALLGDLKAAVGDIPLVMHLHDTWGRGLANVVASVESGVTAFDTALGGMGGCPFIEGATGNIPTEDTADLLHGMGLETGVDINAVAALSMRMEAFLGKPLSGKLHRLLAAQGAPVRAAS
jgi:hydroxymethylglutaryl-CoA lyase